MKFEELIKKYNESGTKCFVNGLGQGKIIRIDEDYITFEITKKAEKQENTTKEKIYIPNTQIFSLSEGEKKVGTLGALAQELAEKKEAEIKKPLESSENKES